MNLMRLTILALLALCRLNAQSFEVASVRQHEGSNIRTGPLTVSGTFIRLEGYTLYGLVMDAWDVRDFQLSFPKGVPPETIYGDMYDIAARAPGDRVPTVEEVRAMLRTLLADRFKLTAHTEIKQMTVYVLSIQKNHAPDLTADPNGIDAEEIADAIGHRLRDRPIVNETNLTGKYRFRIARSADSPEDVIDAVNKLGFKLTQQKQPVRMVVVDAVQKLTSQ